MERYVTRKPVEDINGATLSLRTFNLDIATRQ